MTARTTKSKWFFPTGALASAAQDMIGAGWDDVVEVRKVTTIDKRGRKKITYEARKAKMEVTL